MAPMLLGVLGMVATGAAAEQASAFLTATPLGGGVFDYTLTLDDTGTTNLETFWYAWVPGEDFMPVSPTNILSPANWNANITGGGPNNGFAIQWLTSSSATPAPLTPGHSFTFSFDSTATPAVMAGNSPFYPGTPTGTSFVYTGAPFSDAGFEFTAVSVARNLRRSCFSAWLEWVSIGQCAIAPKMESRGIERQVERARHSARTPDRTRLLAFVGSIRLRPLRQSSQSKWICPVNWESIPVPT